MNWCVIIPVLFMFALQYPSVARELDSTVSALIFEHHTIDDYDGTLMPLTKDEIVKGAVLQVNARIV